MMEIMRNKTAISHVTDLPDYFVGGHIDLTTLTAAGCRVETIRVWNDPIGEPIDTFRTAAPIAGMNRKQRRAMGRGSDRPIRR
jgi:hypothetical protein